MSNIKYLLRVVSGMRLDKLKYAVNTVHRNCGQNKLYTVLDMAVCAVRYGAGYFDYTMFGFYDMNHKQRSTYLTRLWNKKVQSAMNDDNYSYLFDNKNVFNKNFAKYLRRETVDGEILTYEEFLRFIEGKECFFAKGNKGSCGNEVEKVTLADYPTPEACFAYVQEKKFGVLEEAVIQHPDMSYLYPHAVNTMRIVTDVVDGQVYIAYVIVKMGNKGNVVDNSGQDGVLCAVDIENECICSPAVDDYTNVYDKHPYTGVELMGYKLPFVKEALALAKEAALEVPQITHVGWDMAIAPDGPLIIEGNDYPGTDLSQLYAHTPSKTGLLPYYKKLLPDLK